MLFPSPFYTRGSYGTVQKVFNAAVCQQGKKISEKIGKKKGHKREI